MLSVQHCIYERLNSPENIINGRTIGQYTKSQKLLRIVYIHPRSTFFLSLNAIVLQRNQGQNSKSANIANI